jgi:hypothetical protein
MSALQEAIGLTAFNAQVDSGVLEAMKTEGFVRDDGDTEVADNDALIDRYE